MSRVLLVGLAPSRHGDPRRPLIGGKGSGARLMKFAGLSMREYARDFDRVNLFREWPGYATTKGDRVPGLPERRAAATRIIMSAQGRRVIFVGNAVAEAFGFPHEPYIWAMPFGEFAGAAKIPHPSPVSRVLNDTRAQRRFGRFLRAARC